MPFPNPDEPGPGNNFDLAGLDPIDVALVTASDRADTLLAEDG